MIQEGNFAFRKGKIGDRFPSGYEPANQNESPDFVLELDGEQVASACTMGKENHIFMISSFEWKKGYCTKFLELWEEFAKKNNYPELIVSHVASDALEYILENKISGYSFALDGQNEKIYHKSISSTEK
jgi:hypothetical protein